MENTAKPINLSCTEDNNDEESSHILELRALKESTLSRFTPQVRTSVTKIIDEQLCKTLFNIHKDLKSGVLDPSRFDSNCRRRSPSPTLVKMAEHLNITKSTQEVDCPKCFVPVKCLLLSKHLALCMNPQSTYSYSSRNSSRIARQRIQEAFKSANDESKNDGDDEQVKPKKRKNKGKSSLTKKHLNVIDLKNQINA